MMNRTIATLTLCLVATVAMSQTTLEQCMQAAERNYPLIRRHDLIARTTDLTVANIGKAWLPQVSATAQATWQSAVTAWPEQMQAMLSQMGTDIKGLKKDQYRVGIDVNQTLYDGGAIGAQQAIAREQGAVQAAQTEVTLYAVRQRASEMYYGLLLLDDRLRLNADLQTLLAGSEKKLASLYKRGAAAECDYLAVKAERLNATQQQSSLQSQRQTLARMLSTFCGIEVTDVVKPIVAEVE
ncbi:MAG: TolC family protein, partial [Muribaculaceae bacterium]|nr:TolC family protein [Muribaculaceae bacterium]